MRAGEDALGAVVAISDRLEMAVQIVAAFISNNSVPVSEVPNLIASVHAAINATAGTNRGGAVAVDLPAPAVSIGESVTPDYLICLEDGKRFKSLRRHLALLGMTPEQYRAKWSLPSTYPMIAPNLAMKRSEMAKSVGFGRKREDPVAAPAEVTVARKPGRPHQDKT